MARKSTRRHFTMVDDWAMLHPKMDNTAWRVYCILKAKIKHAEGGFPEHGFRMTVSWIKDVTKHLPGMSDSTIRRALVVLTDSVGALRRASAKNNGEPVWYEFVVDPGENYAGAMSMKDHEDGLRRKGAMSPRAMHREENLTGSPHVTGIRYRKDWKPGASDASKQEQREPRLAKQQKPQPPAPTADELASETSETPGTTPVEPEPTFEDVVAGVEAQTASGQEELARLLTRKCSGKGLNRRGILEGEALRVAQSCAGALEAGWTPEQLANRLSSLVSEKIHSIEPFLCRKVADLGAPPEAARKDGVVQVGGQAVDLGVYSLWGPTEAQGRPEVEEISVMDDEQAKRARLAKLGRQARRHF